MCRSKKVIELSFEINAIVNEKEGRSSVRHDEHDRFVHPWLPDDGFN